MANKQPDAPTYTHDGVTYTELKLWKAKSEKRTFFAPAFIDKQIWDTAKDEEVELVSVEIATEDEATAYGEGFYEGLNLGRGQASANQTLS